MKAAYSEYRPTAVSVYRPSRLVIVPVESASRAQGDEARQLSQKLDKLWREAVLGKALLDALDGAEALTYERVEPKTLRTIKVKYRYEGRIAARKFPDDEE